MNGNWRQGFMGMDMRERIYGFGQRMKRLSEGVLIYALAVPVILFYVLVFAGCVSESPGLPGLYLVSISNTNATTGPTADLTVHVGYFGMCAYYSSTMVTCSPSNGRSGDTIADWLIHTNDLNAIYFFDFAAIIQSKIFFYLIAFAGPFFAVSLGFFAICILELNNRDLTNPDPIPARNRRWIAMMAGGSMWTSVALNMASAVSITQVANGLQYFSGVHDGGIDIRAGTSLIALQWLIVIFTFAIGLGVSAVCRAAYEVPVFVDGGNPVPMALPLQQAMMAQPMMDGGYGAVYGGYGGQGAYGGYGGNGGNGMFGGFNPWNRFNNWRQN